MVNAIIFDVFGTLIDTGTGSVTATANILRKRNSGLDPATVYKAWKAFNKEIISTSEFMKEEDIFLLGLKKVYQKFGINGNPQEDVKIMFDSMYSRKLFSDVIQILKYLKTKYTLVLASNTDNAPLMQSLHHNNLDFKHIFTSEDLKVYKPDPRFYQKVIEALNIKKNELIFIGDSQTEDVLGPIQSGINVIWLNRKNEILNEDVPHPLHEITNLQQLMKIL